MSGEGNPTQASAPDPRDLKIAEQARTIAELTDQMKDREEKLAKREALLASRGEAKSSKDPARLHDTHRFLTLPTQLSFRPTMGIVPL